MDSTIFNDDYTKRKDKFTKKWRSNWEAIFRKYDKPYEDDAIIDIRKEKVVHNKGLIHKIPTQKMGTTLFESTLRKLKRNNCKKGHGKPKHESSDSAFESMEPEDRTDRETFQKSNQYSASSVFDYTHGDLDETGNVVIRYQYDEKSDAKPRISGPKEICEFDLTGSDDDDTSSCASGPVDDLDESRSLLDEDDSKPTTTSGSQAHCGDGKDKGSNKCESNLVHKSSHSRWDKNDGNTSMVEAKNNFVRKIQQYLMMPAESEETGESENDTAASASYSAPSKLPQRCEKERRLFKSPSLAPGKSNSAKHERQTKGGEVKKSNVALNNLEFNEYSTIIAGNVDDAGPSCDADSSSSSQSDDDDDDVQLIQSHNILSDLNTTVGGGLKLPQQGAKQIIIGSAPPNQVSDVNVESPCNSPTSTLKLSSPKTPQNYCRTFRSQKPFLSCPPKMKPSTPTTYYSPKSHRTSNTPCTPRNLLRLKSEEMMEIFRSPLPLEITPTKRCSNQLAGFKGESSPVRHHDLIRASPLAKALKKMKEEVEVETNSQGATPPRYKSESPANETYVVSAPSIPLCKADPTSEKTLTLSRMQKSQDTCVSNTQSIDTSSSSSSSSSDGSGHNDTYDFQSSVWRVSDDLEKRFPVDESVRSNRIPKQDGSGTTKLKDNKRKLSEAERDNASISQIPNSHEPMQEKLTRTPKRQKKQEKVLVTSTPIKRWNCSHEEKPKMPKKSPEISVLQASEPFASTAADDQSSSRQTTNNTCSVLNTSRERYMKKCVRKLSNKLASGTTKADDYEIPSERQIVLSVSTNRNKTPKGLPKWKQTQKSTAVKKRNNSNIKEIIDSDCLELADSDSSESGVEEIHQRIPRKSAGKESHGGRSVTPKSAKRLPKWKQTPTSPAVKKGINCNIIEIIDSDCLEMADSDSSESEIHQRIPRKTAGKESHGGRSVIPKSAKRLPKWKQTPTSPAVKKENNSNIIEIIDSDCLELADLDSSESKVEEIHQRIPRKSAGKESHGGRSVTPKSANLARILSKKSSSRSDRCKKQTEIHDEPSSIKVRSLRSKVIMNSLKASSNCSENSDLNSSISSSFVPCEGLGKCTKMFCFSCTDI